MAFFSLFIIGLCLILYCGGFIYLGFSFPWIRQRLTIFLVIFLAISLLCLPALFLASIGLIFSGELLAYYATFFLSTWLIAIIWGLLNSRFKKHLIQIALVMIIVLTTTWIGIWFSRNNPTLLFQSETLSINGTRKTIRGKEILGRLEEVEQLIAYDISKRYLDVASIQFVKVGRNKEHGTSSMFDDEKFYASILVNDSTTLIYKFNLSDDEETTVYSAPTDDDEITLIEDSNFEEFHQQPTSSDIVKQLASIDITYYLKEDIYRYYDPYDR